MKHSSLMKHISAIIVASAVLFTSTAHARWSWNIGYHNPPDATIGANFMHLWSKWALEFGIGFIGSRESGGNRTNVFTVAGDVNMKYLFMSGAVRPYLQGGFGTAIATTSQGDVGVGASLSNPFAGAGVMAFGNRFYVYASYLFLNQSALQLGLGFPF
jgi:hypothetical protein